MFNTNSMIGQSPFLSNIQNAFAPVQQQPMQPMQMPPAPGAQPQGQGQQGQGQQGGDLMSMLTKGDHNGSSIFSQILSLFGG